MTDLIPEPIRDRTFLRDVVLLALILLIVNLAMKHFRVFDRLDHMFYDLTLPLISHTISDKVVVIAIDELSLDKLGRWPWSRKYHAQLLDRLSDSKTRAVGLDLLLSEPQTDDPAADPALAKAIENNGRTVLVFAPEPPIRGLPVGEILPLTDFTLAAAALGHVDLELDIDGLIRCIYLFAGLGTPRWPAFSLAMLQVGATGQAPLDLAPRPVSATEKWTRQHEMLIPFARSGTHPTTYSYVDVLENRVPASTFDDKYVLVGVTATGLSDAVSTPASPSHQLMPGIELNANILSGLLAGIIRTDMATTWASALTFLQVLVILPLIVLLPGRFGIATTTAGLAVALVLPFVMISLTQQWYPPVQAMLSIVLIWPLWLLRQNKVEKRINDELKSQVEFYALHEPYSGLPNQLMLERKLDHSILHANANSISAIMIIHLEWPVANSAISDGLFEAKLIKVLATTCQKLARKDIFVAHLNSGHLALLSEGHASVDDVKAWADHLPPKLNRDADDFYGRTGTCTTIGISTWSDGSSTPNQLLRNARAALLQARLLAESPAISQVRPIAKNQVCVYSVNITQQLLRRTQLKQALYMALRNNELELHYQPQLDTIQGKIVGVEALLRWRNKEHGVINPESFIPVAEETGLIEMIGQWVIENACKQQKAWEQEGLGRIRMAVNVSPLQFVDKEFCRKITSILNHLDMEPAYLELEITESTLMTNLGSAKEALERIKAIGVELAIDDFGTGFSSLNNLRHFPFDRLKIDRTFTREIGQSRKGTEITISILDMAKQLNLLVTAEGIETLDQATFLRQHSCDEFQGFLFSRPLSAEEISAKLRSNLAQPDWLENLHLVDEVPVSENISHSDEK
ncbi:MAG: hypothetical protein CSB48_12615 [Proteobacteria bacterium]|nr:MAG: hypothetical protein CSB48_12615 [Pseudomonadota bacterium]